MSLTENDEERGILIDSSLRNIVSFDIFWLQKQRAAFWVVLCISIKAKVLTGPFDFELIWKYPGGSQCSGLHKEIKLFKNF